MAFELSKEDIAKIDKVLKAITEAKKDIPRFKLAGLDIAAEEVRLLEIETRLLTLRRALSPAKTTGMVSKPGGPSGPVISIVTSR